MVRYSWASEVGKPKLYVYPVFVQAFHAHYAHQHHSDKFPQLLVSSLSPMYPLPPFQPLALVFIFVPRPVNPIRRGI